MEAVKKKRLKNSCQVISSYYFSKTPETDSRNSCKLNIVTRCPVNFYKDGVKRGKQKHPYPYRKSVKRGKKNSLGSLSHSLSHDRQNRQRMKDGF